MRRGRQQPKTGAVLPVGPECLQRPRRPVLALITEDVALFAPSRLPSPSRAEVDDSLAAIYDLNLVGSFSSVTITSRSL